MWTDPTKAISTVADFATRERAYTPLEIPLVPAVLTNAVGSWGGLVAGALLVLAAPFAARLVGATALLGAAVALFGTTIALPLIGQPQPWMTNVAAAAIGLFGIFWFRGRPD